MKLPGQSLVTTRSNSQQLSHRFQGRFNSVTGRIVWGAELAAMRVADRHNPATIVFEKRVS
jgi:hypothetical protein